MWFSSFLLGCFLGGGAGAVSGIIIALFNGNFFLPLYFALYGAIAGGLLLGLSRGKNFMDAVHAREQLAEVEKRLKSEG